MHNDLVEVLNRRLHHRTSELLFEWAGTYAILTVLEKIKQAAGIPIKDGRCWHTLRHTTATTLLEKGVPVRAVMGVLNHTNIETTLRYGKFTQRAVIDAVNVL
jgi:site-specific recombinase XerD